MSKIDCVLKKPLFGPYLVPKTNPILFFWESVDLIPILFFRESTPRVLSRFNHFFLKPTDPIFWESTDPIFFSEPIPIRFKKIF